MNTEKPFGERGLILDVDTLTLEQIRALRPGPGIWGLKVGDRIFAKGFEQALCEIPECWPVFIDEKVYDVRDRLQRKADTLREFLLKNPRPKPVLLSVAGIQQALTLQSLVASTEGQISIVIISVLSDWTDSFCEDTFGVGLLTKCMTLISAAGVARASAVTCPGRLFLHHRIQSDLPEIPVIATGIRSPGERVGGHYLPVPAEEVFEKGASPVIGRMVTETPDPAAALAKLAGQCLTFAAKAKPDEA